MSNLVHNEQMKLAATLFSNVAVVSFTTALLTPMISLIFNFNAPPALWKSITVSILGVIFCVGFFNIAMWFLGQLSD